MSAAWPRYGITLASDLCSVLRAHWLARSGTLGNRWLVQAFVARTTWPATIVPRPPQSTDHPEGDGVTLFTGVQEKNSQVDVLDSMARRSRAVVPR